MPSDDATHNLYTTAGVTPLVEMDEDLQIDREQVEHKPSKSSKAEKPINVSHSENSGHSLPTRMVKGVIVGGGRKGWAVRISAIILLAGLSYYLIQPQQDPTPQNWDYNVRDIPGEALTDKTNDALVALTWVSGSAPPSLPYPPHWSELKIVLVDAQQ